MKGGNEIKIIGKNLKITKNVICRFGDVISKGRFVNRHTIICVVPPSKLVGRVIFSISIKKGIFSGGNHFYTYLREPVLHKITPLCGSISGSTEIFVYGKNFLIGKFFIYFFS